MFNSSCQYCWDYHCDNCIPIECQQAREKDEARKSAEKKEELKMEVAKESFLLNKEHGSFRIFLEDILRKEFANSAMFQYKKIGTYFDDQTKVMLRQERIIDLITERFEMGFKYVSK